VALWAQRERPGPLPQWVLGIQVLLGAVSRAVTRQRQSVAGQQVALAPRPGLLSPLESRLLAQQGLGQQVLAQRVPGQLRQPLPVHAQALVRAWVACCQSDCEPAFLQARES